MSITDKVIINPQKGGDIVIKTITDNGNIEEQIKIVAGVNNTNPGYVEINKLSTQNLIIDNINSNKITLKASNGNKIEIITQSTTNNYSLKLPTTVGAQGQFLRLADNNGTLEWATIQQSQSTNAILWAIIFGK